MRATMVQVLLCEARDPVSRFYMLCDDVIRFIGALLPPFPRSEWDGLSWFPMTAGTGKSTLCSIIPKLMPPPPILSSHEESRFPLDGSFVLQWTPSHMTGKSTLCSLIRSLAPPPHILSFHEEFPSGARASYMKIVEDACRTNPPTIAAKRREMEKRDRRARRLESRRSGFIASRS